MSIVDQVPEFDLWKWMLSKQYITGVKEIVITSKFPIEGFLTFGECWYPINDKERLEGWLNNNFTKRIKYEDVIFLNRIEHPISIIARRIIDRSKSYYDQIIDIHIDSFELEDMDGLKRCLADSYHKYRETLEEIIETEKKQILTPEYFMLKSRDNREIIKHLINIILSTCYNPNFKLVDIPKISVSQIIYGIFPNMIRTIISSDNVIWSEKGTIVTEDKIKNIPTDSSEFDYVINNWIPDLNQRETFRHYAKNIIHGLPWKDVFREKEETRDLYQPYEIFKWLFYLMNPLGKIVHISSGEIFHPENGNMYIYLNGKIPTFTSTTGYNIEIHDQQDAIYNNTFLVSYFGDDIIKHENFFERQHGYLLSLILWSLGDDFPCHWNNTSSK